MTQTPETTQHAGEATQQTTSQPTETTQHAGEATQQTTSQPTETTQQATAPQPEQTAQQTASQQTANSQPAEPTQQASQEPTATTEDLKAQLTALQARLDAIESQRTTERRSAEVERIIAPLNDTLKAVYRRTPFATLTDEEYTQLTETIKKEVTELAKVATAQGAVFSRPTASKPTGGKASDKETEEVLRRLNL